MRVGRPETFMEHETWRDGVWRQAVAPVRRGGHGAARQPSFSVSINAMQHRCWHRLSPERQTPKQRHLWRAWLVLSQAMQSDVGSELARARGSARKRAAEKSHLSVFRFRGDSGSTASFWLRRLGETIVSERHAGRTPWRCGAIFGNGMGAREWIRRFQDSPSGSAADSPVSAVPSPFMRSQPIRLHRRDVTGTQRKPCFVALLVHRSGESSETEK